MNEKRAKKLRKIVEQFDVAVPTLTTYSRLTPDKKSTYQTINPIRYPDGCRRRMYQDAKKSVAALHL